jgi:uncharacterized phiE125 gp8 family phage protein
MIPKLIVDATVEPVTLDELRKQCRLVAFGAPLAHPDDDQLTSFGKEARQWCEDYCDRSFSEKTVEIALDDFPDADIELPSITKSIVSIKYIDVNNTEQTLSNSAYTLDNYSYKNWAIRAINTEWPDTNISANNVKIRVITSGEFVPEPVKQAIKLIVGNNYENRQEDVLGNTRISFNSLPMGVYVKLQPYRRDFGK